MHHIWNKIKQSIHPKPKLLPHQVRAKYNIPNQINLDIEYKKNGWLVITSPDLPGLITQAKNQKQLYTMLNEAVLTYFDVPQNEAGEAFNTIESHDFKIRARAHQLQFA